MILGLWLLYLLSQNQISTFHSELAAIPLEDQNDPHISVPISLEMNFLDGNYTQVLKTKKKMQQTEEFFFFETTPFIETVRTELARSAEASYESLTIEEAQEVFMFDNKTQVNEFVEQQNNWKIEEGKVQFSKKKEESHTIPSHKMML